MMRIYSITEEALDNYEMVVFGFARSGFPGFLLHGGKTFFQSRDLFKQFRQALHQDVRRGIEGMDFLLFRRHISQDDLVVRHLVVA